VGRDGVYVAHKEKFSRAAAGCAQRIEIIQKKEIARIYQWRARRVDER
jgi:hypothetical protein